MGVPNIRFSDFKDDWLQISLSQLLSFNNGINAGKTSYGHGRKFINVLDILNNSFITYDKIIGSVQVSPKIEEANKVEYGDIVFLRSSETRDDVGKSSVYLDKQNYALFGGFVIRGKKIGKYNPYFLKLNLESPTIQNQIGTKAGGSTRFNVSQGILSSININIPSEEEQGKIAEFFSLLELRLDQQHAKVEALKLQKKALVQKIFSQELRFKDSNGYDFPQWRRFKLSDILKERKTYAQKGGEYPHATLSKDGVSLKTERYNRDFLVMDAEKTYKVTHYNDICYNPANLKFGVICRNKIGDAIFSPIYVTFELDAGFIPGFLEYYLCRHDFIQKVRQFEEGTVYERMAVKPEDFLKHEDTFPSIGEQHKIAEFFTTIDEKLMKEELKLEALKEQKKGYLRQMFV